MNNKKKEKRKNILYIEDNRDRTIGGSYFSLLYLVKNLNKKKYNPEVFFHWDNELVEEFKKSGCQTTIRDDFSLVNLRRKYPDFFDEPGWKTILGKILQQIYNFFLRIYIFWFKFPKLLLKKRISIVHINNSFKIDLFWILVPKFFGIRCVCHQRGFVESTVKISNFRRWIINNWLDKVICISQAIEKDCKKHGIFNTTIIFNGLDDIDFSSKIKGLDFQNEFGITNVDHPTVGIVGNIKKWKGQHVVVEAIARLKKSYPRIRCLLIGAYPMKEKSNRYFHDLKNKVSEYQLTENIIFTGYRNDIPDLINELDILLHSSIEPEPFGRVLLEGMALKKPVIATAHGGPMEIINSGESGILVVPGDPVALAEAIKKLTENQSYAAKIAQAGYQQLKMKFTSKINVQKTERLYQSLF